MRSTGYRTPARSAHHAAVFGTPASAAPVSSSRFAARRAEMRGAPTYRRLVQFTFAALLIVVAWNSLSVQAPQAPVFRDRSYLAAKSSPAHHKRPRGAAAPAPASALAPPHDAVHVSAPRASEAKPQGASAATPAVGMVSDGQGGWAYPKPHAGGQADVWQMMEKMKELEARAAVPHARRPPAARSPEGAHGLCA